jgi:hypothetical protein
MSFTCIRNSRVDVDVSRWRFPTAICALRMCICFRVKGYAGVNQPFNRTRIGRVRVFAWKSCTVFFSKKKKNHTRSDGPTKRVVLRLSDYCDFFFVFEYLPLTRSAQSAVIQCLSGVLVIRVLSLNAHRFSSVATAFVVPRASNDFSKCSSRGALINLLNVHRRKKKKRSSNVSTVIECNYNAAAV